MSIDRRDFIKKSIIATGLSGLPIGNSVFSQPQRKPDEINGINPWIELSKSAYLHNVETISKLASNKPVLAVLKNNAYGLGDVEVGQILDQSPKISGIALVKEKRALALREAGVEKPILLMGDFGESLGSDLVEAEITLSVHSYESLEKIKELGKNRANPIQVQLYVDTGLGRMGMPYHQARKWAKKVANEKQLKIVGMFTTLTSPVDFAKEQINRFSQLTEQLKNDGIGVGKQHVAPSSSLLDLTSSHFDMVRPGILLHGSYPIANMDVTNPHPLKPTFRLKAKVIRVEKLRVGDTIGFSRFYTARSEEWIATIPIGWADGYDSGAENGAKVLVGDKLYPVVNVNASHCNLLIGSEKELKVGEVATLIGPDRPEITPEGFAKLTKGHNYLQIQYKESIPKYVYDSFE